LPPRGKPKVGAARPFSVELRPFFWSASERIADFVCFLESRQLSVVDLLGDLNSVIDLDAEIPDGAPDLRMPEHELDRSQIAVLDKSIK
jgi:hypothetical protein